MTIEPILRLIVMDFGGPADWLEIGAAGFILPTLGLLLGWIVWRFGIRSPRRPIDVGTVFD